MRASVWVFATWRVFSSGKITCWWGSFAHVCECSVCIDRVWRSWLLSLSAQQLSSTYIFYLMQTVVSRQSLTRFSSQRAAGFRASSKHQKTQLSCCCCFCCAVGSPRFIVCVVFFRQQTSTWLLLLFLFLLAAHIFTHTNIQQASHHRRWIARTKKSHSFTASSSPLEHRSIVNIKPAWESSAALLLALIENIVRVLFVFLLSSQHPSKVLDRVDHTPWPFFVCLQLSVSFTIFFSCTILLKSVFIRLIRPNCSSWSSQWTTSSTQPPTPKYDHSQHR